jgi:uncharacterized protein (TIGR00725 family)
MWWWEKASKNDLENSYQIWKFCAENNFVTLTGWRNVWVMNEWLRWAKENWWLTVWILPNDDKKTCSEYLDIPIFTNMRSWRNYINALSSDILVVCWIELWTSTEVSLWLKAWKKVILIWCFDEANIFYKKIWWNNIYISKNYNNAIKILSEITT